MRIGKGNQITWRKPAPALLCPPQNAYDLTQESHRLPFVWHDHNKSLLNIFFHLFMVCLITLSLFRLQNDMERSSCGIIWDTSWHWGTDKTLEYSVRTASLCANIWTWHQMKSRTATQVTTTFSMSVMTTIWKCPQSTPLTNNTLTSTLSHRFYHRQRIWQIQAGSLPSTGGALWCSAT
jgi:hypothetical protein